MFRKLFSGLLLNSWIQKAIYHWRNIYFSCYNKKCLKEWTETYLPFSAKKVGNLIENISEKQVLEKKHAMRSSDIQLDEHTGICNISSLIIFTRPQFNNENKNTFCVLVILPGTLGWMTHSRQYTHQFPNIIYRGKYKRRSSSCRVPRLSISLCSNEIRSSKGGYQAWEEGPWYLAYGIYKICGWRVTKSSLDSN